MKELVIKLRPKYSTQQVEDYASQKGWRKGEGEGKPTAQEFVEALLATELDRAYINGEANRASKEVAAKVREELTEEFSK